MTAPTTNGGRAPVLNAPGVVKALLAITVAVHVVRLVLPSDVDWAVVERLALIPARDAALAGASLLPLMGHMVLHADLMHLFINMAFLLAFGAGVAQQTGPVRLVLFYALTGAAGGIVFMLFDPDAEVHLVGASGAVSGLMGGVVHRVFGRPSGGDGGRPGLAARQALAFVAVWLAANWFIGSYGWESFGAAGPIAWQAHMGGFIAGLALYPLFRRRPTGPRAG